MSKLFRPVLEINQNQTWSDPIFAEGSISETPQIIRQQIMKPVCV